MKNKKQSLKQLQVKIWNECKRIIKIRYGSTCYTCGKTNLRGRKRHTGHMIPKKYLPYQYKFDLRFLRPQCYNCNMNLGGMGALFLKNMLLDDNKGVTIELLHDVEYHRKTKNKPKPKDVELFYTELLERLLLIKS